MSDGPSRARATSPIWCAPPSIWPPSRGPSGSKLKAPDMPWLTTTLETQGFSITRVVLYAKAL